MNKVLEIKNLTVAYGSIIALRDVTIDVYQNEIVAIIGANGAGKSTLLNSISGLLSFSGEMKIFNQMITSKTTADKIVKLGVVQVPEGRQIFSELSVLENLQLGAYLLKKDKSFDEDIENVYKLFPRLKERVSQKGGSLSGGEQQMLAIGRAMMSRPKVLLLDEPSMGLAPVVVKDIFDNIKKLHDSGITILLIEQNAKLALNISDRAYVFETGKIKIEGKSSDLINDDFVIKSYLGVN